MTGESNSGATNSVETVSAEENRPNATLDDHEETDDVEIEDTEEMEEAEELQDDIDSSDDDSIASESEIMAVESRIDALRSSTSHNDLSSLMKHTYRILTFWSKKYGESSPLLHAHYLSYAESFFRVLRKNLEEGVEDETEDRSVADDWDVVVECLRRALTCAQRQLSSCKDDNDMCSCARRTMEKSLELITCVYIYREHMDMALESAKRLHDSFPSMASSIILAEAHVFNQHYASAKSIITDLVSKRETSELTQDQQSKIDELHELLFHNDPSKIKWDVHAFIQKEYKVKSTSKGASGNIVSHFVTTSSSDTNSNSTTAQIPARRKRPVEDIKESAEK